MKLLYIGIMLIGYLFSSVNTCGPIWEFEEHRYCDGGTYTLYLCTDEQGQFTNWMSTCSSSVEEYNEAGVVFLPLMIKGE
jgi:hypothetical protein